MFTRAHGTGPRVVPHAEVVLAVALRPYVPALLGLASPNHTPNCVPRITAIEFRRILLILFFGRKRLKGRSEKTEIARPEKENFRQLCRNPDNFV